ncbi:hypothetical protein L1987_55721 [Smallanthus sonchifolius]|uniref:Uncharacterized protein n=1 Tax=Smallanthus sonchifolius TaxID=185202 RepID=A0ACB9EAQ9_9ASTR|nr:hypothetical protein L1987_55721 [Smallanthus sonchifolius]
MDDGSYYFDDKHIDVSGHQGPLSATAVVVQGLTTFASTSESLNVRYDTLIYLRTRFWVWQDFFLELGSLEIARVSVPLVLSLPATVLSLTSKDKLKVKVSTVLGSIAPPLSVKLMQVFSSGSKDASELHFDPKEAIHMLDALPVGVDIGKYVFAFEIVLSDPEDKRKFATGGRTKVPVHVTGVVKVDDAKVAVLEGDIVESEKKYENSFLQPLGSIELDLPKAPEKATQPPPQAVNPYLRYGPKAEIAHIFRPPEKRPPQEVSFAFLAALW